MKIRMDLNKLDVLVDDTLRRLYRINEKLPKDKKFFLDTGAFYKYSDREEDKRANSYVDSSVFIFDTEKDFISSINEGDGFEFFFNHKPEKIKAFEASYTPW